MSAKLFKKLSAKVVWKQGGQEKNRWHNMGAMFIHDDGSMSIKIDSMPVGGYWNGWVSLFDPEPRQDAPQQQQAPQQGGYPQQQAPQPSFDDDIPF